ncbi:helix-turn-helix domain-containing protein|uniref:helix-turn-helix domain-containing protein n=1 Tax=Noviherbaspirillum sp. L7-7A TaxID=2850560 RepID=UPI001C2BA36B|nr:helix-turn-helix domain-containing protein [Noviherbaspirillum sp. L7-7A]MBV0881038.1 helix-turn-helix domain-containing protein [Noviherbaspirillum sp. L7-7A]
MSISFMALAWKTDIPAGRKLVLLSLCDHADDQGECYPSVEAIAQKCSMGQRTVQQHISDLERAGMLVRRFRKGRSTLYQVHPDKFFTLSESAVPQISPSTCAASDTLAPQHSHHAPADPAPINVIDSSTNRLVVRSMPLPGNWALPPLWAEWALQQQSTWTTGDVEFVAEKFRDHWSALPGPRGMKADWFAAWRNWCRNEQRFRRQRTADYGALRLSSVGAVTHHGTPNPAPLPGESVAVFKSRIRQQMDTVDTQATIPLFALRTDSDKGEAKPTISSANRAAALQAARALQSRRVKAA